MMHNLIRIKQLCIIVFYIEKITCDIDFIFDEAFVIKNTEPIISISLTALFDSEEVDDALLEWADSSRSPGLKYYYVYPKSIQTRTVAFTLAWNADRTAMERKDGGGTLLFTVLKNSQPVENKALEIAVHWKPDKPNVQINEPIILGNTTQFTCDLKDKGKPEGIVVWVKNGTNQTDPQYINQTIQFTVTKEELHQTQWQCFYYNSVGQGEIADKAPINVLWPPGKPKILTNVDVANLVLKDKVTLTCKLSGVSNPVSQPVWTNNGVIQTGEDYSSAAISITISREHNFNQWGCYFFNTVSRGPASEDVTLVVKWKPGKPNLTSNVNVTNLSVGQTVSLTCALPEKGSPTGSVVWKTDGSVQNNTEETVEFPITRDHNGTKWSCFYYNTVNEGPDSDDIILIVTSTIPLPGNLEVTAKTARSLNISIDNSGTDLQEYKYMKLLWRSNESIHWMEETIDSNLRFKLFRDLDYDTYYNMQFAFVHGDETGYYKEISDSTEDSNVIDDTTITREWLSAVCIVNLADLDSNQKVVMMVCDPAGTNCITEMKIVRATKTSKRSIQEQPVRITVKDNSFGRRLVNVTVYDSGVLVYDYSDYIDAPVAAIALIVLGAVLIVAVIIIIIVIIIKKTGKMKPQKEVEEEISPYGHTNPALTNESRTGTGHETKAENPPPVTSVVNKGKPLAPIAASQADGDVYSQVDWSKKIKRPSLKGSPMSKKAIDKIMFSKNDGYINMQFEVSKKFAGDIDISVCLEGDQSCTSKVSKQHARGTKNVIMVLPIEETSNDKYAINMKFIMKGQMVQEVDLTYPYEQNAVHVTVMNDAYVTSGTDVKASEMPAYSEVNKSKKTKGSEMPIYSEVNKPKKKKKAAEEQPYEDVETKNQSSHNERSTNAVSPSNAEVAVEGVPPHPPRKGAPKEGVMYAELDLNSSGAPRLLPRLGSKSPAQEPVIYADVRPGQKDVV